MPHQKPALWIQERAFYPVTLQEATPSGWPWNLHRKRWRVTLPRTLIASTCTFGTLQEGTIGNSCIYGSYGNSCFLCFNTSQISSSASVMAIASFDSRNLLPKNTIHVRLCQLEAGVTKVCVCVLIWAPWFGWACPTISMQLQVSLTNSVQGNPQPASKMGRGFVCFWFYHHVQFWFCHNFAFLQQIACAKWRCISQSRHISYSLCCATLSILNRCTFVQGKSRLREASHNLPNGPYDDKR